MNTKLAIKDIITAATLMLDADCLNKRATDTYLGAKACLVYSLAHDVDYATVVAVRGMLDRNGIVHSTHDRGNANYILQINK